MAKVKSQKYRLVKVALREICLTKGAPGDLISNNFNIKSKRGRREVTVTLMDIYFEYLYQEHPIREGWYRRKVSYTYKNVESLKNTLAYL